MNTNSLLVSCLVFSILLSHVQGIRLNKGFMSPLEDHKLMKGIVTGRKNTGADHAEAVECKDGLCSGDTRKLMAKATSNPSITRMSKNDEKRSKAIPRTIGTIKDERLSINSSSGRKNHEASKEQYPDVIDLAGMDYSPAKRKSPIHN